VFVIYAPARASSPAFRFLCWKHCPPTSGLYVMNVELGRPKEPVCTCHGSERAGQVW
jgi:hypothetical protein